MNYIFTFFIIISVIFSIINGTEAKIFQTITTATGDCGLFVLKLTLLTAFFSGIVKVAEDSGIMSKLSFFVGRLIKKIFSGANKKAFEKITLNITANMLGIGNAATPLGLFAMEQLDKDNNHKDTPSYDMCKFIIFNTCSVQLIPTTILGLRAMHNSQNPAIIIIPVIVVSVLSLLFGLLMCKLLYKM